MGDFQRRVFKRTHGGPVKWRVPDEDGLWHKVPIKDVPTYHIICLLNKFQQKGYTKIKGLVSDEDAWMLKYITELETEFDNRNDVEEYL